MDENNEAIEKIPESPKPLAFTVDFSDGKQIDTQRHKSLVEKFQRKHRRGQSLSKIDEPPSSNNSSNNNTTITTTTTTNKKHPSTGNLPRKSSFHSDGYLSSDEKTSINNNDKNKNSKRSELSLTLKNTFSDKMSQSFPNAGCLFNLETPMIELKDVSSPELDLISPFSPKDNQSINELPNNKLLPTLLLPLPQQQQQQSSPINGGNYNNNNNNYNKLDDEQFIDGTEFDFDKKSDTVSDAGTYTLDADNYSEEQKARMSIDAEFKIEHVTVMKKTEDYIKSLYDFKEDETNEVGIIKKNDHLTTTTTTLLKQQKTKNKLLSPILSPTQNLSITESLDNKQNNDNNADDHDDDLNKTFTRIIFPSPKSKNHGLDQLIDQGSVISVTSSGAFRTKNTDTDDLNQRKKSLTQSEIHVEAYIGEQFETNQLIKNKKLTANIINVQSISVKNNNNNNSNNNNNGGNENNLNKITNLPPNGKISPTKIPSPIHTITRPRSRNSLNMDLSDSSLETESYLKSTQDCINTLKQRLSLDNSDHEIDDDDDNGVNNKKLNNLLNKQRTAHTRHNSLDDKISNKLEHFHLKNLQTIDQTTNVFNQYNQQQQQQQQQLIHKIQNSPSNSPIRRSSSFSTKNFGTKNTNLATVIGQQERKETNLRNSPNLLRTTTSIQRSASTANIKPNYLLRRSSINSDQQLQHHSKIDRNQYGDTDTSSEEDFDKQLTKKKDLSLLTNTRYNRAFSLRRGRLDDSVLTVQKCPNTPEMRRKFPIEIRTERAISVDRKPTKTNDIQSRYLLNITKKPTTPSPIKNDLTTKNVPKIKTTPGNSGNSNNLTKTTTPKNQVVFSRTDSGRFSTRSGKPPSGSSVGAAPKNAKKDQAKKSNGRCNSSLSSREKEFQNWKRRKSYDPMKAAAEGKRKELAKKQNNIMTQSYNPEANQNQDCDSSPSHSSSVHRSQSFHGTAALGQLISSEEEEEEEDLTLSADEGFSPPTPSPCELSPARAILRNAWKDHILH